LDRTFGTLGNSDIAEVFRVFALLGGYRAAAATSTEVYNNADTKLQLAKTEWQNAKRNKEHCINQYRKFNDLTESFVANKTLGKTGTKSARGKQITSKDFRVHH
jgi:hypothetical protein